MNIWNRHLKEVGEGYFEHFRSAICFAKCMFGGSVACAIHAFFPFLFERTGSSRIEFLHEKMVISRIKNCESSQCGETGPVSIDKALPDSQKITEQAAA